MSNKRIVKNSIYLYIRLIVTMFVGIFTSRFVLSALGVSDYGLYNVVGGVVSLMAFVNTMLITTSYRFIAYEQGKPDGDVNRVFNVSFTLHIIAGLVIILLAATVGTYYIGNYLVVEDGKLADAYFVFFFSVINVLAQIVSTPFSGLLVANEKFAVTVPIEIGTKVAVLAIAILLNYIPSNHLRVYVVMITIAHYLNPIGYVVYCFKNFYSTVRWKFQRGIEHYKAMFSFTGWNMIEVSAIMGEHQGSNMIINRFFGTMLNASFGVANQLNSMVKMFSQGLGQAVVPQITKSYSAGDHKRSSQLVILASKFSFFLMAIPMLPILLEADFILGIWLKEVPEYTSVFVKAMLIRSIIGTSLYGLPQLIDASGNIKWFKIITSGTTLLVLPLSYIVFKLGYPAYTISYIFIASAILGFITTMFLLKTVLQHNIREFLIHSTLRVVLVSAVQIPMFFSVCVFSPGFLRFIVVSLVSELLLCGSVLIIGMNKQERYSLIQYVKEGLSRYRGRSLTA